MREVMLESREAVVNYMMPLGLHHIFAWGHHYGPEPWCEIEGHVPTGFLRIIIGQIVKDLALTEVVQVVMLFRNIPIRWRIYGERWIHAPKNFCFGFTMFRGHIN